MQQYPDIYPDIHSTETPGRDADFLPQGLSADGFPGGMFRHVGFYSL